MDIIIPISPGTNHFGHFAFTKQLMQDIESKPTRIAVLASSYHVKGNVDISDLNYTKGRKYEQWEAYGQSKMANILYAKELQARGQGAYTAVSLHPGAIKTNLSRHLKSYEVAVFNMVRKVPFLFKSMIGQYEKTIP